MEWRGLQGARGSVYALMSGADSGEISFFACADGTGLRCYCCGQTAGGSGAASAAQAQTHTLPLHSMRTHLPPTFIL